MNCPSCAVEVPDGARFCPACGTLLVQAEERRVVTVLFADLVGFTALSEQRDPESIKLLVDRCFQRLVADITAFGGRVDKIVGDAIVALFGAPVAHEDDAERAVRAALRMQRTLNDLRNELGVVVQMRIGVNTGEVLVGSLRAGGDYTAMGDTVNTASRLEAAAKPGEVWVGPATHAATVEVISYESRGTLAVRGREAAVAVNAAVHELTLPGRRPRRTRAPLVGRAEELELLEAAISTAVARGQAHLLLLLGDAGMGKTRLAEELAIGAELEHEARVLESRCLPYGETSPWWPLAEALREALHVEPSDGPGAVEAKVAQSVSEALAGVDPDEQVRTTNGLLQLMGVEGALSELDRGRARDEAISAVVRYLAAFAEQRPLVLVISDVHWADRQLLDLAERLLVAMRAAPFVMVATTRWNLDDERWVAKPGRHNSVLVNLLPLDRGATARLATSMLGTDVTEELAAELYRRSGGNPFFIEEMVNLLIESASPTAEQGADPSSLSLLPETLRGLVSARLDALTSAERAMVDDAAVIGRDGPVYALLLQAQGRGETAAEGVFGQLVAKDLFETDGEGWRFRSELVRDVAYSTLTKTGRAQRHAAVAEWLAANPDRSSGLRGASRISYHWRNAARLRAELGEVPGLGPDVLDRALESLAEVGRLAELADSNQAAGKAYTRILELAPPDRPVERLAAHLGRARIRLAMREVTDARLDATAACELAEQLDDSLSLGRATLMLAEVALLGGDHGEARILAEQGRAAVARANDVAALDEAVRQVGMIHLRLGDHGAAESDFRAALASARQRGDVSGEAWCLQHLAWLAFEQGRIDAAEAELLRSLDLFEAVGDVAGTSWANGILAYVRFYQGRRDEARQLAVSMLGDSTERGEPWAAGMGTVLLASIDQWDGQCRLAGEAAQEALSIFDRIDDDLGRVQALATLGRSLSAQGRVREAEVALERARRIAVEMPGRPMVPFVLGAAIGSAAQIGSSERAMELLDTEVPARSGSLGAAEFEVGAALAELQAGRGDPRARLARVLELDDGLGSSPYRLSTLALIEAVADRPSEALARADEVLGDERSTYLDRRTARIAAGLVHARAGRRDEAIDALEAAVSEIDATESRMSQAVTRLARALAYEALDLAEAADLGAEADRRLSDLGVDAAGWRRLFRLAAGLAPLPSEVHL